MRHTCAYPFRMDSERHHSSFSMWWNYAHEDELLCQAITSFSFGSWEWTRSKKYQSERQCRTRGQRSVVLPASRCETSSQSTSTRRNWNMKIVRKQVCDRQYSWKCWDQRQQAIQHTWKTGREKLGKWDIGKLGKWEIGKLGVENWAISVSPLNVIWSCGLHRVCNAPFLEAENSAQTKPVSNILRNNHSTTTSSVALPQSNIFDLYRAKRVI